jgi:hypothetical protein
MDKNAIIAALQNNPKANVGQGENIFVPMTQDQREARKSAYNGMKRAGLFCIALRARLV